MLRRAETLIRPRRTARELLPRLRAEIRLGRREEGQRLMNPHEQALKDLFAEAGVIENVKVLNGCAFIHNK
jgi:hypothetical protein